MTAVFLLANVSCFLRGSATPSIKIGYQVFSIAGSDTASIILFAGILIILFQSLLSKRFIAIEKGSIPSIIKLGLAQTVIQYVCFYVGLAHTSGVTGTILTGTSGFFSIILACLLFRTEKLSTNKVIGCVLGVLGVIVMNVSFGSSVALSFTLIGEGLVLCSSISLGVSGRFILIK